MAENDGAPKAPRRRLTVKDHIEKLQKAKATHLRKAANCDTRIAALQRDARDKSKQLLTDAGLVEQAPSGSGS